MYNHFKQKHISCYHFIQNKVFLWIKPDITTLISIRKTMSLHLVFYLSARCWVMIKQKATNAHIGSIHMNPKVIHVEAILSNKNTHQHKRETHIFTAFELRVQAN